MKWRVWGFWLLASVGHNWGHIFLKLSIAASGPYLANFSATLLLWCIFNASLYNQLTLFGLCFVFVQNVFFFFLYLPVLSYTIKSVQIQTWIPWPWEPVLDPHVPVPQAVSCMIVYMRSFGKRRHQNTVHQSGDFWGLTPHWGRSEAWEEERSVCLKAFTWVLVDESVKGLAGFQEPTLQPLKPSKNTNWSPPTTMVSSGQQSSWRQCSLIKQW